MGSTTAARFDFTTSRRKDAEGTDLSKNLAGKKSNLSRTRRVRRSLQRSVAGGADASRSTQSQCIRRALTRTHGSCADAVRTAQKARSGTVKNNVLIKPLFVPHIN